MRKTLWTLVAVLALGMVLGCGGLPDVTGDKAKAQASQDAAMGGDAAKALIGLSYNPGTALNYGNQYYGFTRMACVNDSECGKKAMYAFTTPDGKSLVALYDGRLWCSVPDAFKDFAKLDAATKNLALTAPFVYGAVPDDKSHPETAAEARQKIKVGGQFFMCGPMDDGP